jgi:hypothetical protein
VSQLADPAVLAAVEMTAEHEPDAEAGSGLYGGERGRPPGVAEPLLPQRLHPRVVVDQHREPGRPVQASAECRPLRSRQRAGGDNLTGRRVAHPRHRDPDPEDLSVRRQHAADRAFGGPLQLRRPRGGGGQLDGVLGQPVAARVH